MCPHFYGTEHSHAHCMKLPCMQHVSMVTKQSTNLNLLWYLFIFIFVFVWLYLTVKNVWQNVNISYGPQFILVWLRNHAQTCSWNQPVLSYEGKVTNWILWWGLNAWLTHYESDVLCHIVPLQHISDITRPLNVIQI